MIPVIGLTGGIGSGKSTVAGRFESLGATVIDTDEIARRLTGPGGAAMEALGREFGARYVAHDGALDRAAMRQLAFEDATARGRLESILHPAVRQEADAKLASARGPYAIVAVPLLFESRGFLDRVARTLVVDCPEDLQLARTVARSALDPAQVRLIMSAQWPRWRRLQMAGDVIWNGGTRDLIGPQCDRLHGEYVQLAQNTR